MKIQRYKHDSDTSYALGMALTIDLVQSKRDDVQAVFVSSKITDSSELRQLTTMCQKSGIPIEHNDKAFNILSPKGNIFVIGAFRKFSSSLATGNHVVLVNPQDAGNLGTIIRTAVGLNIPNIAIIRPAVDIFDPKVIRSSMGAVFRTNFQYFNDFNDYKKAFSNQNLYSFMLKASTPINEVSFDDPYSLIFGNEASGLSDSFAEWSKTVIIPQTTLVDSFSLPIAVSIAMFVAQRPFKS